VILVDSALAKRAAEARPVRVALVGAGFMGRGLTNQIINSVPGMDLVAIANRTLANAERAYLESGRNDVQPVANAAELDRLVNSGGSAITTDYQAVTDSAVIDVIIEATGAVEYGCQVVARAIDQRKHVVLMNAEVDGTVGPILAKLASEAGAIYTGCDGDQPGVQMNLVRFVRSIGLTPLVCGNIKGLQDPHRTPTTQRAFAERWGQDPHMVTSFADGTKISFEQATVANATGMSVSARGMRGGDHSGHVDELTSTWDVEYLRACGGVVDYVVGAKPGPGVYVLATHDDPKQRHYLELYKLGTGPLYSFYTPYHLCHFEVPLTAARAVLFGDATIKPVGAPTVEVITTAKRDLPAGTRIDGLGGYDTYGQAERADITAAERLLPMGVAEGCRLVRDIAADEVISYDDVESPEDRLVDELRTRQAQELPVPTFAASPN
jgi:predicted homoserine dehydrogenase-like protein